jgi:hypothetical protein
VLHRFWYQLLQFPVFTTHYFEAFYPLLCYPFICALFMTLQHRTAVGQASTIVSGRPALRWWQRVQEDSLEVSARLGVAAARQTFVFSDVC